MFKIGDHVEVVHQDTGDYPITGPGSRGVVLKEINKYVVQAIFYKQNKEPIDDRRIWDIEKDCLRKIEEPDLSEKALEKQGIWISNGDIVFKNDPNDQEGGRIVNRGKEHILVVGSMLFSDSKFAIDKDNIDDLILALWLAKKKFYCDSD